MVELALVAPVLVLIVFATIDLGRVWAFQNRLSNAAREASFVLSASPKSVDSSCNGTRNAVDAARSEDVDLSQSPGYKVTVARQASGTGSYTDYTGCGGTGGPVSGDHVKATVSAQFRPITPLAGMFIDNPTTLKRSAEVVVQ